jgi:hypothetical protein
MIFDNNDAINTAGWLNPNQPPPPTEDIKGLETLRRLYELEARATMPHMLKLKAPLSEPQLDKKTAAAMRGIRARNSKAYKALERRIDDLERTLQTLTETTTASNPSILGQLPDKKKKKKKKKKAAESQEE